MSSTHLLELFIPRFNSSGSCRENRLYFDNPLDLSVDNSLLLRNSGVVCLLLTSAINSSASNLLGKAGNLGDVPGNLSVARH
eukprot:13657338-Heterocapsa_arctica.AAC.1